LPLLFFFDDGFFDAPNGGRALADKLGAPLRSKSMMDVALRILHMVEMRATPAPRSLKVTLTYFSRAAKLYTGPVAILDHQSLNQPPCSPRVIACFLSHATIPPLQSWR